MQTCICLATNVLMSKYQPTRRVVGVSRWEEWVGKATAYKFVTCTLIEVHLTMHLMDPIKVHVTYTCTFMVHAQTNIGMRDF